MREALGASEDIPRFGHVVEKAARKDERPAFPRLPLDLRVFRVDGLDPHLERVRLDLEDLRGHEAPEQPLPWLFAQGLTGALPQVMIQRRQAMPVASGHIGPSAHEERRLVEMAKAGGDVERRESIPVARIDLGAAVKEDAQAAPRSRRLR